MPANSALPWSQYTELVVGRGHPTFTDVDNRALRQLLASSGFGLDTPFYGFPLGTAMYSTASYPKGTSGNVLNDNAVSVNATVAQCIADGIPVCWVDESRMPYNANNVTFSTAVKMVRASGNPLYWDMLAYGYQLGDQSVGATPSVNAATAGAKTAASVGGGTVFFPAGQYWFMSSPTALTGDLGVTWLGQGRNSTSLVQGAAGVTICSLGGGTGTATNRFVLRDLWIGTFSNFATGGAINWQTTGYPSTPVSEVQIHNVKIENSPNPLYFDNVAQFNLRDLQIVQTRASATIGHLMYLIRSVSGEINNTRILTTAGTLPGDAERIDSDCDTLLHARCEHVLLGNGASTAGFRVTDSVGAGTHPPRIIQFSHCTAENGQNGFVIEFARGCFLIGGEVANHNAAGVYLNGGIGVQVIGVQAFLNQQEGIRVAAGSAFLIAENLCSNNSQASNGGYDGITIGSSDGRVINNRSGDVFFTLTNKQKSGINFQSGTDHLAISGNVLHTNLGLAFEQPIINSSTGQNNQMGGNGFVSTSPAAIAAGLDAKHLGGTVEIETTLTGALLVAALGSPFIGQRFKFTFIQDGTGGRAVTWVGTYKLTWSDTGNTLNKRSSIAVVWDGTNFNQDGAQTPYV